MWVRSLDWKDPLEDSISSLFFLLLLSSELFASFSTSFLLPIYLLDFSQPLPFPLVLPFILSFTLFWLFFWGGVARFQVLGFPHQGLNSGLQQWKCLNPNHCQGSPDVFYFLMSLFLSFLFSDSLFLSSSFLFICHSSSRGWNWWLLSQILPIIGFYLAHRVVYFS